MIRRLRFYMRRMSFVAKGFKTDRRMNRQYRYWYIRRLRVWQQ
jgi:hypothetical protein